MKPLYNVQRAWHPFQSRVQSTVTEKSTFRVNLQNDRFEISLDDPISLFPLPSSLLPLLVGALNTILAASMQDRR